MKGENGSLEGLLSGAGIAIAAAVLMLVVFTLFRSTGQVNSAIALHTATSEVCGDIGTAAVSALAYNHCETYPAEGITIRVTSDYVVASDSAGDVFARPLTVRVFPGSYSGHNVIFWNDTAEMRDYINRTIGSRGTEEEPFNVTEGNQAATLMEKACLAMASNPLCINAIKPLTVEKLFLYTYNDSSQAMESDPYVFVYQR